MRIIKHIGTAAFVSMAFVSMALFGVSTTYAADAAPGKQLYDDNCQGCHDTRIHTRPNRIIHTYGDLVNRVKFCDTQVKTNFSETQIKDVTDYLNTEFYKFVKE